MARKPAITGLARPEGIKDDIAKGIARGVKAAIGGTKKKTPSRNATKKMIVAQKKRNAYNTIVKNQDPMTHGWKSDEDVAKLVGKSKYYKQTTTRKQVSKVRKQLKGK